jgi:hypothetical protein
VRVAALDMNGDGLGEIATAAGAGGGPQITIVPGTNVHAEIKSFFGADQASRSGFYVAGSTPPPRP